MNADVTTHWKTIKFDGESFLNLQDEIVTEFPLTLMLDGEEFATMVCTPTDVIDLVVGFLASEGIIRTYPDIKNISVDLEAGFAYIELVNKSIVNKDHLSKRVIGSCCGKSRQFYFLNDMKTAKTVITRNKITVHQCIGLMKQLEQSSIDFHKTGGLHNAALCDGNGLLISRTDIGRHNALDKVYGHLIQNPIPVKDKIIAFSGRVSSEVLLKISKMGVGILLSKSAPSDLALQLAEELGITVVGFIRNNTLNIYTHLERIDSLGHN